MAVTSAGGPRGSAVVSSGDSIADRAFGKFLGLFFGVVLGFLLHGLEFSRISPLVKDE